MKAERIEVAVPKPPAMITLTMSEVDAQALQDSFGNYGHRMAELLHKDGKQYQAAQTKEIYYPIYTALASAGIIPKYK